MVEGICIPLDVRHDLVRNVTTRGRGRSYIRTNTYIGTLFRYRKKERSSKE